MKRLWIFCVLLLCACQPPNGTGTGNPFSNQLPSSGAGSSSISGYILGYTCQLLNKCNPSLSLQTCGQLIIGTVGFGPKLGITQSDAMTGEEILTAENAKQIIPDAVQADKCSAAILRLQCSDPKVQAAYDPGAPAPLANAPQILDPVCTGVFSH